MANWILSNQDPADGPEAEESATPNGAAQPTPPAPQPVVTDTESSATAPKTATRAFIDQRRKARMLALQALYEIDTTGHAPDVVLYERLRVNPPGELGADFLIWLVAGVMSHRERIDALIHRFAPDWPVNQLAPIDRSILRLALYELGANDATTPPKVTINEAVELAKSFGGDSSPRFVNGVLGAALADARKQAF